MCFDLIWFLICTSLSLPINISLASTDSEFLVIIIQRWMPAGSSWGARISHETEFESQKDSYLLPSNQQKHYAKKPPAADTDRLNADRHKQLRPLKILNYFLTSRDAGLALAFSIRLQILLGCRSRSREDCLCVLRLVPWVGSGHWQWLKRMTHNSWFE